MRSSVTSVSTTTTTTMDEKRDARPQQSDRTSMCEKWNNYITEKRNKLVKQFNEEVDKCAQQNSNTNSKLFAGVCIYVNGYTQPSALQLKQLMVEYGGQCLNHYDRTRTTHTIASNVAYSKRDTNAIIVSPKWIVDCIEAKQLLKCDQYVINKRLNGDSNTIDTFLRPNNVDNSVDTTKTTTFERVFDDRAVTLKRDTIKPKTNRKIAKKRAKNIKSSNKAIDAIFKSMNCREIGGVLAAQRIANVCGKTDQTDVIEIINEWVSTEPVIVDEDVAYIINYFCDLIQQKQFDKFKSIVSAFRSTIDSTNDEQWKDLYSHVRNAVVMELSSMDVNCDNIVEWFDCHD